MSNHYFFRAMMLMLCCFAFLVSCDDSGTKKSAASKTTPTDSPQALSPPKTDHAKDQKTTTSAAGWEADDYRNKNWKPAEGKYYFSELWTYTFLNEMLPNTDPHHKGEISFYVDPPSGTILLERNASNYRDEMTDWILISPDGGYQMGYTGEHGERTIDKKNMNDFPNYKLYAASQAKEFNKFFTKGKGKKEFGATKYNDRTLKGTEYQLSYAKTSESTTLYLASLPFSVRPLYMASKLSQDLSFPINLGYGYLLPEKKLVLSEKTMMGKGREVSYELTSIGATQYFLDLKAFKAGK